ncbi:MAG: hypothetical protein A2Y95_07240 [Deltaproteobacteria bacterium RBG_13_65_10]|nr:MAG: hypothetical protein A2Y95_07240 [Deltaproteobacteria bacterium RBG_13_65_10]
MEDKLLEFVNLLRKSGLRVSTSESIEAFQSVQMLSLADRRIFKSALAATLVKRASDLPTFDNLFEMFFAGLSAILGDAKNDLLANLQDFGPEGRKLLEDLLKLLDQEHPPSELLQALLRLDTIRLEQLIRRAAGQIQAGNIENQLQIGYYTRRLLDALGWEGMQADAQRLEQAMEDLHLPPDRREAIREFIRQAAERMRRAMREFTEMELDKQNYNFRERFREQSLQEKSFYHLSEEDVRRMREVVRRLALKFKNVIAIRRRRERRGKLDVKHTLRRNMSHGGVPFEVAFKQRKKMKPQIVTLCDVSSSVSNVSRFMLQFIYSLQENFSKVRSFVFVSDVGEVTQLFTENDLYEAIERALRGETINVYSRSNFGHAFYVFQRDHLAAINKRTTVIVIGDARNNYNDPKAWTLKEIQHKAKRVIWLNPESPGAWGFGDSVMDKYVPYCDHVEECRNLKQLIRVVDRLIIR